MTDLRRSLWPISELQGRQDKYLTLETYVDGEGDFGGSKDESGTFTDLQEKNEHVISTMIPHYQEKDCVTRKDHVKRKDCVTYTRDACVVLTLAVYGGDVDEQEERFPQETGKWLCLEC